MPDGKDAYGRDRKTQEQAGKLSTKKKNQAG